MTVPTGSVGSGVEEGKGVRVAGGEGAPVGAIVAMGGSRSAAGVAGTVVSEDAGRLGEGVEDADPPTGSGVAKISVDVGRIASPGKRAFVRSAATISSDAPIAAMPIQLYLLRESGAVGVG